MHIHDGIKLCRIPMSHVLLRTRYVYGGDLIRHLVVHVLEAGVVVLALPQSLVRLSGDRVYHRAVLVHALPELVGEEPRRGVHHELIAVGTEAQK